MTPIGLQAAAVVDSDGVCGDALIIDNGAITWVGSRDAAPAVADIIWHRYADALITPGFVDAHVHLTSTGIALEGLDLGVCRGAADVLWLVAAEARELEDDDVVFGHGWDESGWSDPGLPSLAQIDEAAAGRSVYLSRVDVHSALASSHLRRRAGLPDAPVATLDGCDALVRKHEHGGVRQAALASISAVRRAAYQRTALMAAAAAGITSVHENGGPVVSSAADLRSAMDVGRDPLLPSVVGYWGALGGAADAAAMGAQGAAGDLFIDGSLGSRTAHLCEPYADADSSGVAYVSRSEMASHIADCIRQGVQAGFHVIGDAAMAAVAAALDDAVTLLGEDLPPHSVRLEHAEMVSHAAHDALIRHRVALSMQPVFDAHWGGARGMYAQRLGAGRASMMNRVADHLTAGLLVGFGSDSPVTAMGPWQAMAAAVHHHNPAQRISPIAALTAHTRSAHALARRDAGGMAPGAVADVAVWRVDSPEVSFAAGVDSAHRGHPPTLIAAMKAGRIIAGGLDG